MASRTTVVRRYMAAVESKPHATSEPFPFVYRINGGGPHTLDDWTHARELLCLLGLHPSLSFVILERSDDAGRWVQALGAPEAMVVEVASGDGPLRVSRRGEVSPRSDVISVQGLRVSARVGERWSAGEVAAVVRSWLTAGCLPSYLDAELVVPLDWDGTT